MDQKPARPPPSSASRARTETGGPSRQAPTLRREAAGSPEGAERQPGCRRAEVPADGQLKVRPHRTHERVAPGSPRRGRRLRGPRHPRGRRTRRCGPGCRDDRRSVLRAAGSTGARAPRRRVQPPGERPPPVEAERRPGPCRRAQPPPHATKETAAKPDAICATNDASTAISGSSSTSPLATAAPTTRSATRGRTRQVWVPRAGQQVWHAEDEAAAEARRGPDVSGIGARARTITHETSPSEARLMASAPALSDAGVMAARRVEGAQARKTSPDRDGESRSASTDPAADVRRRVKRVELDDCAVSDRPYLRLIVHGDHSASANASRAGTRRQSPGRGRAGTPGPARLPTEASARNGSPALSRTSTQPQRLLGTGSPPRGPAPPRPAAKERPKGLAASDLPAFMRSIPTGLRRLDARRRAYPPRAT